MTALQKFCEKLFCEEEVSDNEGSNLLVEIMNALGFSKREREIKRHEIHLRNVLTSSILIDDKFTSTRIRSTSEGMCGGIYNNKRHNDYDLLFTYRYFKLYTPGEIITNNPPNDNVDYDASFLVEEDDNFPGYVKLSLAEVKTNCVYLVHCTRINDEKLYLLNYMIMNSFCKGLYKSSDDYMPFVLSDSSPKRDINGPAHSVYGKDPWGYTVKTDSVYCIHYDTWPKSVKSFITSHKPNNWPSTTR